MQIQYVADDGVSFDTKEECIEHEQFNQEQFRRFQMATFDFDSQLMEFYESLKAEHCMPDRTIWSERYNFLRLVEELKKCMG